MDVFIYNIEDERKRKRMFSFKLLKNVAVNERGTFENEKDGG